MTTTIVKPGEYQPRKLDTSFIGRPHHQDPRRLYSQTACDWQQRVDFERMRNDRLARLREQMNKFDLGALVLFAGANVRYATGSYQGNWKYNINIRYCVLPQGGEPVLFETAGSDLHCARSTCPGCRKRFARPSPGSGPKAPFPSWPTAWSRASGSALRPTACRRKRSASITST